MTGKILFEQGIPDVAHVVYVFVGATLGVLLFAFLPFDANRAHRPNDGGNIPAPLSSGHMKTLNISTCSLLIILCSLANHLFLLNVEGNSIRIFALLIFLPYVVLQIIYYVLLKKKDKGANVQSV